MTTTKGKAKKNAVKKAAATPTCKHENTEPWEEVTENRHTTKCNDCGSRVEALGLRKTDDLEGQFYAIYTLKG